MKYLLNVLFVMATLAACNSNNISGSGNIKTETRTTSKFTGLETNSGIDVEVRTGNSLSVVVEADDNVIDDVETRVENNVLIIGYRSTHNFNDPHVKVMVTAPYLSSLTTSSSGNIEVMDKLTHNNKITFEANSSGEITAAVDAPSIDADVSSSGTINLSGTTREITAKASSSGDLQAGDLKSEKANADAGSSGTVVIFASKYLNAKASSSGDVTCYGKPEQVVKDESTSGSVTVND